MAIDMPNTNLYDVASRNAWLDNNSLVSTIPGSVYGPCCAFTSDDNTFDTNVTDQFSGLYYSFQPFADIRFRLAFADSVNLTSIDESTNNMGTSNNKPSPQIIP